MKYKKAETNYTLTLPNGQPLRWKHCKDHGSDTKWWRTYVTPTYLNTTKDYAPLYDFWSNASSGQVQQSIIIADFDSNNPADLALVDELGLEALDQHPNLIGFSSVSGRRKLGFVIETTRRPTKQQAEAYLLSKLPKQLHWFDRKGMSRCYFNKVNFGTIQSALSFKIIPDRVNLKRLAESVPPTFTFHEAKIESLPEELRLWAKDAKRTKLLKILTACWGLLEQFNLPQSHIAEQLGCSITHVSQLLKELRNLDVVRITDKSFIQGKKAQTYKACGALYKAIQRHKATKPVSTRQKKALPTEVQDGQFWRLCLSTMSQFRSKESFLAYVSTLGNITLPRQKEATKYATCHFRKQAA